MSSNGRVRLGLVRKDGSHGGIEGQVLRLATRLQASGYCEPVVITGGRGALVASCEAAKIPVEVVPGLQDRLPFKAVPGLAAIVRRRRLGLIQAHGFRESIVCRMVQRSHPTVAHVFRAHMDMGGDTRHGASRRHYHLLNRLTDRYVSRYVANGRYVSDELVKLSGAATAKVDVIYNGRDRVSTPDEVDRGRERLPPRIAMVARATPSKRVDMLIDAVERLRRVDLAPLVRIIGGPAYPQIAESVAYWRQLKERVARAGLEHQVEFVDFVDNVWRLLRDTPIIVLPSERDGIPNCLLEAMSVKKLIVASRVGGIPEMISHGQSGLLHDVGDLTGFTRLLQEALTRPARQLAPLREAAHAIWHARFRMEPMVDSFVALYDNLLRSGRGAR